MFALLLRSTTLPAASDDILETQTVVGSPGNYSVQVGAPFSLHGRAKGWLAMGGQIVDATVIEARRPRLATPGEGHKRLIEIAVPAFGYKNHVGIPVAGRARSAASRPPDQPEADTSPGLRSSP
jgi:hypothetical protein